VRYVREQEFFYESIGERILKIGPHLPKLLSNIKWLTFLRQSVVKSNTASILTVHVRQFSTFTPTLKFTCFANMANFSRSFFYYIGSVT